MVELNGNSRYSYIEDDLGQGWCVTFRMDDGSTIKIVKLSVNGSNQSVARYHAMTLAEHLEREYQNEQSIQDLQEDPPE